MAEGHDICDASRFLSRRSHLLLRVSALSLMVIHAGPAAAELACPAAGLKSGLVETVDQRLDLTLKDGLSLHLAGVDPPQATPDHEDFPLRARDVFAAGLAGAAISYLPLAAMPDRWGRMPALVFLAGRPPGTPAKSAAVFLLANGLARATPVPEVHGCWPIFLAAEAAARSAKLGLWRDPYYAILAATDRVAFAVHAAENVIVQGRLAEIRSDHYRLSLSLAPRGERALTVTVLQRNVAIFDRSGLHFRALIGRTLRVRGELDLRFGPHIEISNVDDIELIADGQRTGGPVKRGDTVAWPPIKQDP